MRRKLSLLSSGVCPSSGYCAVALTSINSLGSLASWSWCLESVELRLCCWLISRPQGQCWQDWGAGGAGLHVLTVSWGGGLQEQQGALRRATKGQTWTGQWEKIFWLLLAGVLNPPFLVPSRSP